MSKLVSQFFYERIPSSNKSRSNNRLYYDQNNNQVKTYTESESSLNNALFTVKLVTEFNGSKYSAYILKTDKDDPVKCRFNCISGPDYDNIRFGSWETTSRLKYYNIL